ncbi:STM3941 family protein [Anaerocolumna sp. MB42-C2]|uniref:STM3941 family protein n=1 Tax=Anaerocolumna sp. MB42-C2 TaxID=3070997 RepID=UPI0027E1C5CD|nr:STM3941 family protein [Anaerocolumna sp. MB42-C2]WMJ85566.1 STM3941 family protein [Anaerocolumna sp. MB42-C2]
MEKIVIEMKQSKSIKLMLIGFLLLLLSIFIWILGLRERKILVWLTGLLSMMLSFTGFLIYLGRVLQRKPLLTITFDGIIDSSSVNSVGYIPFQDIKRFCIVNNNGQKVIGVIPKDEKFFTDKLSPIKQRLAKNNIDNQTPPFTIRVDKAKDMSLEDIYTLLTKRLSDYSSLYD